MGKQEKISLKNELKGKKKWSIIYGDIQWLCGVAIDFEGCPAIIAPASLKEYLLMEDRYEMFCEEYGYDVGLWFIPDNELFDNLECIQSYMEKYSPYWFADNWDGCYEIYRKSN